MMEWYRRASGEPARVGVLAGTFNPPTIAHLELARAAAPALDEILFVLPHRLPHKPYHGATFGQRIALLELALGGCGFACSIAGAEGGLFIEIARECRLAYSPEVRLSFLCGRDAAERIVEWDYGTPGAFDAMLDEFDLLVAARAGEYRPAPRHAGRIRTLPLGTPLDRVSSSSVRERIARGEPWEHLVPAAIVPDVRRIYR